MRPLLLLPLLLSAGSAAAISTPPPPTLPAPAPTAPAPAPAPAAAAAPGATGSAFSAIVDKQPIPSPPQVNARSWILLDHSSGRVLAENKADEHVEPASLTKLMTAYVVFHALSEGRLKLTDPVTISEHAWRTEGSRSFVQVGTQIPVDVLVKGMIVQSGNDATTALAEKVGGTEAVFVQLMNEYAKRLGMSNTRFVNSDGLPAPDQYSSARDIATLSNALIGEFPQYYSLFSLREFVWNNIHQENRNGLLGKDPSVDGLKTGHTDSAGFCLASSANRNGMRLVSVVMGAPSIKAREEASAALLNYGYSFYETLRLKAAHDTVLKPRVYLSAAEYAPVGVANDVYVTVGRGQSASLRTNAKLSSPTLKAPLAAGANVGEFTVVDSAGGVLTRVPLVTLEAVPEGSLWTRLSDGISLWFH
jgi:serine-type D-Ala-D-Ala carboxypeptidase (penicillin-binding protein 5/6)